MGGIHWFWRVLLAFIGGTVTGGFLIHGVARLPPWFYRPTIMLYQSIGGDMRRIDRDQRIVFAMTTTVILPVLLVSFLLYGLATHFSECRSKTKEVDPCSKCGYNLTGNVSGTCPECGQPIDPAARST